MFNQKSLLILFIDRSRLQLYGGNLTGIVSVEMPDTVTRDLDVVSKDTLYVFIKQWLKQYAVSGSQLVMIFAESSYFDKLFSPGESTQMETDVLKFFEMVPFESIWTKVYPSGNGKRAVAINKGFYEALRQGFSLQGVSTKAVIPAFALGPMSTKRIMDRGVADYVLKNLDMLMKQSLLDSQEWTSPSPQEPRVSAPTNKPKEKSSMPLLLGVFGVLILILIIVAVVQFR